MYKTAVLGSTTCARLTRKKLRDSPASIGCERNCFRAPKGLAFFHWNGTRLSLASDSGSTNRPQHTLASAKQAEAQNGARGEMAPRKPPSAGPSTKPMPNAAPISPKLAARFSGGVTSDIYAPAVLKLAAQMPDITRPTNSHQTFGASAIRMKSRPRPVHEIRITARRPK